MDQQLMQLLPGPGRSMLHVEIEVFKDKEVGSTHLLEEPVVAHGAIGTEGIPQTVQQVSDPEVAASRASAHLSSAETRRWTRFGGLFRS